MNAPLRNRFEIFEAVDSSMRNEIYRFRYRIYVEQMGRESEDGLDATDPSQLKYRKQPHAKKGTP